MKYILVFLSIITFFNYDLRCQNDSDYLTNTLFHDVQMQEVFQDSKTFPDCTPIYSLDSILNIYEIVKDDENFSLKEFIDTYFSKPLTPGFYRKSSSVKIEDHIHNLWDVLTRDPDTFSLESSSLIPLPYKYIVPGGRFREIYYWDSYFTMLGLQVSNRYDLIESMINNFSYLIDIYGYVPNGNRTYFLGRSQPPFFSLMLSILSEKYGDTVLVRYLSSLEKEYNFWMDGAQSVKNNGDSYKRVIKVFDTYLNRYYDHNSTARPESYKEDYLLVQKLQSLHKEVDLDLSQEDLYKNLRAACESGWDFSTRWFDDNSNISTIETMNLVPIDLNSLLYYLEFSISKGYEIMKDTLKQQYYDSLSHVRKEVIKKYFWDDNEGFFGDYDSKEKLISPRYSLAGAYPLFFSIASSAQASIASKKLEQEFLKGGGLTTTLVNSGQQWDSPNGWAPLHWMTIKGLDNYGLNGLAEEIAHRWLKNNRNVYSKTGKLVEKYNVKDLTLEAGGGEYKLQDGFGWTNGVYLKLISLGYK